MHPVLAKLNQPKCGAHAFRRFRLTWLRKNDVPKDLERFWMAHEDEEIGDRYSKLKQDVGFRQAVAKKIGFGFELPAQKPRCWTEWTEWTENRISVRSRNGCKCVIEER